MKKMFGINSEGVYSMVQLEEDVFLTSEGLKSKDDFNQIVQELTNELLDEAFEDEFEFEFDLDLELLNKELTDLEVKYLNEIKELNKNELTEEKLKNLSTLNDLLEDLIVVAEKRREAEKEKFLSENENTVSEVKSAIDDEIESLDAEKDYVGMEDLEDMEEEFKLTEGQIMDRFGFKNYKFIELILEGKNEEIVKKFYDGRIYTKDEFLNQLKVSLNACRKQSLFNEIISIKNITALELFRLLALNGLAEVKFLDPREETKNLKFKKRLVQYYTSNSGILPYALYEPKTDDEFDDDYYYYN